MANATLRYQEFRRKKKEERRKKKSPSLSPVTCNL
jgi:hypothetical protein